MGHLTPRTITTIAPHLLQDKDSLAAIRPHRNMPVILEGNVPWRLPARLESETVPVLSLL